MLSVVPPKFHLTAPSFSADLTKGATLYVLAGTDIDLKSTRLNSSHPPESRMPSSA